MHHRSAEFMALSQRVWSSLSTVFETSNPVVVLAGSGTTGIEASLVSTATSGSVALVLVHGRFGERIAEMHRRCGIQHHIIAVPWGSAIPPERVTEMLHRFPEITSVWMVHSETSTGVTLDVDAIAAAARSVQPDILIAVDAVASIGIHRVATDRWGLDLVMTASQKGLLCPPGLAAVSVSARAERIMRNHAQKSYTMDLTTVLDHQRRGLFPWTPPVTLVAGLNVALQDIIDEGIRDVIDQRSEITAYLHSGLRARGFRMFGLGTSYAVTVVEDARANTMRKALRETHGIVVAGGQDQLQGKVMRIGTCGRFHTSDIDVLLNAIDDVAQLKSSQA